ncbi:MAG: LamG domain-containing protein, partial [Chloroflexi bacterium]|nr:LamG domain-containing protein [Chloroflexota bacterium]
YTFLSRATDNVGNQTAAGHGILLSIQVDNTAPLADLQYTGPSTTTITTTVTLSGVITDPGSVAAGLSRLQMAFVPGEQVDVVSGTIVLLHFDEPTGAQRFEDSSGQGHHGACSGTSCPTAGVSGKVDQALRFDGANDYVEVSPSGTLDPGHELTLAAWVKLVNPANTQKIVGKTTTHDGYLLGVGNNQLFPEIWDSAGTRYNLATGSVPANTWTHLAVTWQTGGQMIGYINGTEVGRLAASAKPIGTNTLPLRVGVAPWNPAAFGVNGLLDEVTVYDRALAAWEVQALYQAGSLAWADTTLAASGPGITTTTWSQAVPQGLEGIYQIDLRGTDVLHNRNEQRLTWNAWRGQVDTLAPRAAITVTFTGTGSTAQTGYTCWAQDFNLYERTDPHDPTPAGYDFQCPCFAKAPNSTTITRTTYDQVSPWYRSQFTDTTRLYALTATCTVTGHQTDTVTVHACDIFGHCTEKQTSPQLSLLSSNDNPPLLDAVVLEADQPTTEPAQQQRQPASARRGCLGPGARQRAYDDRSDQRRRRCLCPRLLEGSDRHGGQRAPRHPHLAQQHRHRHAVDHRLDAIGRRGAHLAGHRRGLGRPGADRHPSRHHHRGHPTAGGGHRPYRADQHAAPLLWAGGPHRPGHQYRWHSGRRRAG